MNKWLVLGTLMFGVLSAQADDPFVKASVRIGAEAREYDLVNAEVKIYTEMGMLEYRLDQIKSIAREGTGQTVRVSTVYGDHRDGQLINQGLEYLDFDDRKWLSLEESIPLQIEVAVEQVSVPRDCFDIQLVGGERVLCNLADAVIEVAVDGREIAVPLSSAAGVEIYAQTAEEGDKQYRVSVIYAGDYGVVGDLVNQFAHMKAEDLAGHRVDLPLEKISAISNALYGEHRHSTVNGVEDETVRLRLGDGREERVLFPFGFLTVNTAARQEYQIPTAYLSALTATNNEFEVSTVFGDSLVGRLGVKELSFTVPGRGETSNRVVKIAVSGLASVVWPEKKFVDLSKDDLLLEGSRIAVYMPRNMMESFSVVETNAGECDASAPLLLKREEKEWLFYNAKNASGCRIEPRERNVSFLSFCDGLRHEVRWRSVDEVAVNGGYEPLMPAEPEAEVVKDNDERRPGPNSGKGSPKMRPGHVLEIRVLVSGETEIDEPERRITSSGDISLPLLGTVRVNEMTIEELEAVLTSKYSEYIRNPQVVIQYVMGEETSASPWGYVTVLGTVKEPGKVNIPPTQDLTVSMAIQQAGGFDTSANDKAIRLTRRLSDGESEQYDVNLRNVGARGELKNDMILVPGDIVYVPEMMF